MLALGRGDVAEMFVSLSARHPEGRDAEYLAWHTLDHRAEQHRLPEVRGSLRFVSTPGCRSARAASDPRYEATDHAMVYLFTDQGAMGSFYGLGEELFKAGRMPHRLPAVEGDLYTVIGKFAAQRAVVGADVLPWCPALGAYLLIELGVAAADRLVDIEGVAGVWWAVSDPERSMGYDWFLTPTSPDEGPKQVSLCFIDGDPIDVARRLQSILEDRWAEETVTPLLAAPFFAVIPYEWDRHLP